MISVIADCNVYFIPSISIFRTSIENLINLQTQFPQRCLNLPSLKSRWSCTSNSCSPSTPELLADFTFQPCKLTRSDLSSSAHHRNANRTWQIVAGIVLPPPEDQARCLSCNQIKISWLSASSSSEGIVVLYPGHIHRRVFDPASKSAAAGLKIKFQKPACCSHHIHWADNLHFLVIFPECCAVATGAFLDFMPSGQPEQLEQFEMLCMQIWDCQMLGKDVNLRPVINLIWTGWIYRIVVAKWGWFEEAIVAILGPVHLVVPSIRSSL